MVAVVVGADLTDQIPLLNESLTVPGLYNKGINNIGDFRRMFLGALTGKNASAYAWRTGILCAGLFTAGVPQDGLVGQVGGGGGTQAVTVKQHRSIAVRSGVGPYLMAQDGDVASLAAPAADGTNPRIDLLCEMPYDKGAAPSDAQHGPKYIWVTGDPAGSPSVPAKPAAVADANILARVTRAANDNTIATADILDQRNGVSLHGAPRPIMGGDSLTEAGMYHMEMRHRLASSGILAVAPALRGITEWWSQIDSNWHATQEFQLSKPAQSFSGTVANGVVQTIASVTIPDLGFPIRVLASGCFEYFTADTDALIGCQVTVNTSTWDANVCARGLGKSIGSAGGTKFQMAVPVISPFVPPGAPTIVRVIVNNFNAASGISVVNNKYDMALSVMPI